MYLKVVISIGLIGAMTIGALPVADVVYTKTDAEKKHSSTLFGLQVGILGLVGVVTVFYGYRQVKGIKLIDAKLARLKASPVGATHPRSRSVPGSFGDAPVPRGLDELD